MIDLTLDDDDAEDPLSRKAQREDPLITAGASSGEGVARAEDSSCAAESAYLIHFTEVLDVAFQSRADYSRLFTPEEATVAAAFQALSAPARALYVRLMTRKGPWFRVDSMLGYDEVGSGVPPWLAARRRRQELERLDQISGSEGDSSSSECVNAAAVHMAAAGCLPLEEPQTTFTDSRNGAASGSTGTPHLGGTATTPATRQDAEQSQDRSKLFGEIQAALSELIAADFAMALPATVRGPGPALDTVLAAVDSALRQPELVALVKAAAAGAAVNGSNGGKSRTRKALLEALRDALCGGQRTLWGVGISISKHLDAVLAKSAAAALGAAEDASPPKRRQQQRSTRCLQGPFLAALAEGPCLLFRRAARLVYMTCHTAAVSSGATCVSTSHPPPWGPGLMVAFGKARKAEYLCRVETAAFVDRAALLRWEAAVELRCAMEDACSAHLSELRRAGRDARAAAKAKREASADQSDSASEEEARDEDSEEDEVITSNPAPLLAPAPLLSWRSPAASKVANSTAAKSGVTITGTAQKGKETPAAAANGEMLSQLEALVACFERGEAAATAAKAAAAMAGVEAVILVMLASSCCLHAHARVQQPRASVEKGLEAGGKASSAEAVAAALSPLLPAEAADIFAVAPAWEAAPAATVAAQRPPKLADPRPAAKAAAVLAPPVEAAVVQDAEGSSPPFPEFLLQLDAGWVLASSIWEGVAVLERARAYPAALSALSQLLATKYTPHRRGRWWNRLAIDLEHLSMPREALAASNLALSDQHVVGGDRITIEKRCRRLAKRWVAAETGEPSSGNSGSSAGSSACDASAAACCNALAVVKAEGVSVKLEVLAVVKCELQEDGSEGDAKLPSDSGDASGPKGKRCNASSGPSSSGCSGKKGRKSNGGCAAAAAAAEAAPEEAMACSDDDDFEPPRHNKRRRGSKIQRRGGSQNVCAGTEAGSDDEDFERPKPKKLRKKLAEADEAVASGRAVGSDNADRIDETSGSRRKQRKADSDVRPLPELARTSEAAAADSVAACSACLEKQQRLLREGDHDDLRSVVLAVLGPDCGCGTTTAAAAAATAAFAAAGGGKSSRGKGGKKRSSSCSKVRGSGASRRQAESLVVPEIYIKGRRLNCDIGIKSRFVGYDDGETMGVEELVLQRFAKPEEGGWAGWHCEGGPLRAIFWLLCWEEVFTDVPDVFQAPFQDAPLDLDCCPLFFASRREALVARLSFVREASAEILAAAVAESWRQHRDMLCRGVRWDRCSPRLLQATAVAVGGRGIAAVCAAFALSYKHFSGGMPDLLMVRAKPQPEIDVPAAAELDVDRVATAAEDPRGCVVTEWLNAIAADAGHATVGANSDIFSLQDPKKRAARAGKGSGGGGRSGDAGAQTPASIGGRDNGVSIGGDASSIGDVSMNGGSSSSAAAVVGEGEEEPFTAAEIAAVVLEARLIEVKGPKDRLSDRQLAWLRIMGGAGIMAEVCHVVERDAEAELNGESD